LDRASQEPPTQKFPFSTDAQQKAFYKWYGGYTTAASQWAVGELLKTVGEASPHRVAAQIVELPDSLGCRPGLKLA
jgi:hypothetical protein